MMKQERLIEKDREPALARRGHGWPKLNKIDAKVKLQRPGGRFFE